MGEAVALSNGLDLVIRMGCNRLMIESDCSEVVEAFNDRGQWWSAQTTIFTECVDKMATIGWVSVRHIHREANQVAHVLAQDSYTSHSSCNWVDEPLVSF
jgi:ribonuclease HI